MKKVVSAFDGIMAVHVDREESVGYQPANDLLKDIEEWIENISAVKNAVGGHPEGSARNHVLQAIKSNPRNQHK